ncbi:nucleolar complex protein 2 homolog isoform X2 [Tripterygium wilfordii]|uniref:nucleolar complex protein 2 homolog isoform X2 n=1 Tax=Tripterygium wilfordii TaxID=458696 RepID=UPI0018F8367B|nr:nucleolar complex protein 2 homolog isoform X2 [Tripterygium wilfordii]
MAKKLGMKARKFAKKNLPAVHKRRRKLKSTFKKRNSKGNDRLVTEDPEGNKELPSNGRLFEDDNLEETSLDAIFSEHDSEEIQDDSGSDGYLSQDSCCTNISENNFKGYEEGSIVGNASSMQIREIHLELAKKKKKLEKLKEKDPDFSQFLESYNETRKASKNEEAYSDEDVTSDDGMQLADEDISNLIKGKLLTRSVISSLCQLVREQHSVSAFTSLLNGYRYACHYGSDSTDVDDLDSSWRIEDAETLCKILSFVLYEADKIFRELLGVSCSNCRKEAILELKNSSKWKSLKPLVKTYLRSTLFLVTQFTDSKILAFAISRIRTSVVFFAPFPTLLRRLVKIVIHLWATGERDLSSNSILILQDVASVFSSDYFDTCLIKTYKAFIAHCKFAEPSLFEHLQFLRNSFVELCSQDVHKSSTTAIASIRHLAKILQLGLRTKNEEAVKRICSWQYMNCVDLWVTFISVNVNDYDLQPLLYMVIQIINGVALLFPGPRYLPMRIKCVQWLNQLSNSSGIFIPVASFVLEILEYSIGKDGGKPGKNLNFSSVVQLPKHWLKSRNFQDLCVFSALELLSAHFAKWSSHISFPELATITLIRLRKFDEITDSERFRRVVKRFIDQVEQNIEYVRKKRDEVAFSPNDQQSADSFLQPEKFSGSTQFMQYYRNVMENASSRNLGIKEKTSFPVERKSKKRREPIL